MDDLEIQQQIASELGVQLEQVAQTVCLLDEGNTIPFIARYRKELTGELDEVILRKLDERLHYLRNLEARKQEIKHLIEEQDKLTKEITREIYAAVTLQQLEDIYRPFRPKRRTKASMAKDKGLELLAQLLWAQPSQSPQELCQPFLNEQVPSPADAISGAMDILAENIADDPSIRQTVRHYVWNYGVLVCEATKEAEATAPPEWRTYFGHSEPVQKIPPHRVLAINRGEREKALKVRIELEPERLLGSLGRRIITNRESPAAKLLAETIQDSLQRLLGPSVEREIRNSLTQTGEEHSIDVFAKNLRSLLLQQPVHNRNILGIDPAYRTGCKVVVVNQYGDLLDHKTIYPHKPQGRWDEATSILQEWIGHYAISLIVIGNGTASRETEQLVASIIKGHRGKLEYLVVNEAGASVYSASDIARQEFPDLDVSVRGAVSIARRVLDPMAELVKIDPRSIGVGLYQHDVNQKALAKSLSDVVESCVNFVGVELNSASTALLRYVAGLSPTVAREIVTHRQSAGGFQRRGELKNVKGLGPKTFQQCAGFLRIVDGSDPLDTTAVHPESYPLAREILKRLGHSLADLKDKQTLKQIQDSLKALDPQQLALDLQAGEPTVRDILATLAQPGRDPREDVPPPLFRADVLAIEDLQPGMVLQGAVQNVVDFGAFVDIGVKKAGLVHISQISHNYIKHPTDVLQPGDIVEVKVLTVDADTERISLTMKDL